jgi:hypothetical protein
MLLSKYHQLGIEKHVASQLHLFKVMVQPVLSYGCEIWGPSVCGVKPDAFNADIVSDNVRFNFFRHLLGVRGSTPRWALLRELGEYPLQFTIMRQMGGFFTKVLHLPDDSLVKIAMLENMEISRDCSGFWFAELRKALQYIDYAILDTDDVDDVVEHMKQSSIELQLLLKYEAVWHDLGDPRTTGCDVKLATYKKWFAIPETLGCRCSIAPYLRLALPYEYASKLARFRLRSHNLAVETDVRLNIPRCQRVCTRCTAGVVDDEVHAVFQCAAFCGARAKYPALHAAFAAGDMLSMFSKVALAKDLVRFVTDMCVC